MPNILIAHQNTHLSSQDTGYAGLAAVASPTSCEQRPQIRILRLPDVIGRVGLKRASIYQYIGRKAFPPPINLGSRAVGWVEHEIDAWVAARIEITRRRR